MPHYSADISTLLFHPAGVICVYSRHCLLHIIHLAHVQCRLRFYAGLMIFTVSRDFDIAWLLVSKGTAGRIFIDRRPRRRAMGTRTTVGVCLGMLHPCWTSLIVCRAFHFHSLFVSGDFHIRVLVVCGSGLWDPVGNDTGVQITMYSS